MNLCFPMFYFSFLGRDTVDMFFSYTLYVCFRPQQPCTVELSIFKLNLDLKFTSRKGKTTFSKGNDGAVLAPPSFFFFSGSHACPLPDLPQFESNH